MEKAQCNSIGFTSAGLGIDWSSGGDSVIFVEFCVECCVELWLGMRYLHPSHNLISSELTLWVGLEWKLNSYRSWNVFTETINSKYGVQNRPFCNREAQKRSNWLIIRKPSCSIQHKMHKVRLQSAILTRLPMICRLVVKAKPDADFHLRATCQTYSFTVLSFAILRTCCLTTRAICPSVARENRRDLGLIGGTNLRSPHSSRFHLSSN